MKKRPSSVPVASRDAERAQRAAERAQRSRTRRARVFPKQDMASVVILISVVLLVLLAIAAPLRNYYEGRAEIARAQESIERLEARKQALESDIAMYEDDAFMRQEARRRLGVVEEGETVWRILDPRMSAPDNITTAADEIPDDREWSAVLWDSLRDIPEVEAPESEAPESPEANTEAPEQEAPQLDAPQPEAPAAPEQPAGEAPAEAPAPDAPAQ
ncbi:septum formation initiator family protein [Corynebacterium coyleae]|uniref:septum formation initiator family protein n=1 Tax=Corynebacterium coyleae TaxID=53374 RepID=UPI00254EF67F|nr:septum formation initiator family protein [Corynebacterium coyleae]MDK8664484.1 septum formation initiator family protein [Corynebacterium coyleae]MDK8707529.1 septum formation initiator family protein [Corynebacterium coyleae]MDK8734387.1 septum formation initiator family protein [Corynebacterium coyleae]MDK8893624.1 septum formation initiator family protein [Corynebacterium coyleae]